MPVCHYLVAIVSHASKWPSGADPLRAGWILSRIRQAPGAAVCEWASSPRVSVGQPCAGRVPAQ